MNYQNPLPLRDEEPEDDQYGCRNLDSSYVLSEENGGCRQRYKGNGIDIGARFHRAENPHGTVPCDKAQCRCDKSQKKEIEKIFWTDESLWGNIQSEEWRKQQDEHNAIEKRVSCSCDGIATESAYLPCENRIDRPEK